jgi:hypothetical protein
MRRRFVDYTLVRHGMDDWRFGANEQHIEVARIKSIAYSTIGAYAQLCG